MELPAMTSPKPSPFRSAVRTGMAPSQSVVMGVGAEAPVAEVLAPGDRVVHGARGARIDVRVANQIHRVDRACAAAQDDRRAEQAGAELLAPAKVSSRSPRLSMSAASTHRAPSASAGMFLRSGKTPAQRPSYEAVVSSLRLPVRRSAKPSPLRARGEDVAGARCPRLDHGRSAEVCPRGARAFEGDGGRGRHGGLELSFHMEAVAGEGSAVHAWTWRQPRPGGCVWPVRLRKDIGVPRARLCSPWPRGCPFRFQLLSN